LTYRGAIKPRRRWAQTRWGRTSPDKPPTTGRGSEETSKPGTIMMALTRRNRGRLEDLVSSSQLGDLTLEPLALGVILAQLSQYPTWRRRPRSPPTPSYSSLVTRRLSGLHAPATPADISIFPCPRPQRFLNWWSLGHAGGIQRMLSRRAKNFTTVGVRSKVVFPVHGSVHELASSRACQVLQPRSCAS
jgi:hypothetical protein